MVEPITRIRRGFSDAFDPVIYGIQRFTGQPVVRAILLAVILALILIYPLVEPNNSPINTAFIAEYYVLLALGLNIVVGYAGLLDLGYAAFFAIGAYALALLASPQYTISGSSFSSPLVSWGVTGIHVNFYLMIPIAAGAAALCGVLFGAPTLRLRGDYLAIVTLGFGEIVPIVVRNLGPGNSLGLPNITNGVNRITGIDTPPNINLGGTHWSFQSNDPRPFYYLALVMVIVSIIIIASLRRSRLGRAWAAIREDEVAAAHMGINITRTRLYAFGLGAAFSGFGGVLVASQIGSVEYVQFSFNISVLILVMVVLGGMGSIPGVMLGAVFLTYLDYEWLNRINGDLHGFGRSLSSGPSILGDAGTWLHHADLLSAKPLIYGLILLAVMLLRPQGIWPSSTRARELQPQTSQILAEEREELYSDREETAR